MINSKNITRNTIELVDITSKTNNNVQVQNGEGLTGQ